MQNKMDATQKGFYIAGILVPVIGLPVFFFVEKLIKQGIIRGCPVWTYLHLYCPGCGGSRAVHELLSGHLLQSFRYHPIVLYVAVIYVVFMVSNTLQIVSGSRIKGVRFHNWYLYGALILIGVNWIVKNVLLLIWGITLPV